MKGVLCYWGFLALAAAIASWVTHTLTWVLILIFAAGAFGYFLLQAPVWCGPMTRDGQMCRNNSTGLLLGRHLREHRWQKPRMTFVPRKWHDLNRGLWASPREGVNTVSGLASAVVALAAVIGLLLY
jgi:hypothetical protein